MWWLPSVACELLNRDLSRTNRIGGEEEDDAANDRDCDDDNGDGACTIDGDGDDGMHGGAHRVIGV